MSHAPALPRTLDRSTIERTRTALRGLAVRTPLIPVTFPDSGTPLLLKLEQLQPIGSFKIRGAGAAMAAAPPERLREGVLTASAGNMAQGVAWCARERSVPCTVIVPETAAQTKVDAVTRLGARVIRVPFATWWQTMLDRAYPGVEGVFIHPVSDPAVLTGNATTALEILEDVPDVETVYVPFGGGGLSCGIAMGLRAAGSRARVVACEVETAAPFSASLTAQHPVAITHQPSFVDGIGGGSMLPEMWPLASTLLGGAAVVSLAAIAEAIRKLAAHARVVAEGAGAASVAAARRDAREGERSVCVVSGGNIDLAKLAIVLGGGIP